MMTYQSVERVENAASYTSNPHLTLPETQLDNDLFRILLMTIKTYGETFPVLESNAHNEVTSRYPWFPI
jgi:hypothetical protein